MQKDTLEQMVARAAEQISTQMFEAHRGVLPSEDGVCVVFGNDGYSTDRVKLEVELIRQRLADANIKELCFVVTADQYTWAMVVQSADVDQLTTWLWEAAYIAFGIGGTANPYQQAIAGHACFTTDVIAGMSFGH